MHTDPVCGQAVVPHRSSAELEHGGTFYYFCSELCVSKFLADRERYVQRPALASSPSKHALAFVTITVLIDMLGLGLILPVLPKLLVELDGGTLSDAAINGGWLAFTYATTQLIFAPILGNLSDRYGRRPVLLFAIAALGLDYLVMGFAPTLVWLFAGRTLAGIAGASFTAAYAYVADISQPEKRAQNFGVISAAFGAGFIIGPALGGLLAAFGPRAPFFAAAALALINFAYGWCLLPESLVKTKRRPFEWKRANPIGALAEMRKHRGAIALLFGLFLWMLGHQVMPATWSFYTKYRFDWSEAMIGVSLAFAGVVMVVSQTALLRFAVPKLGERRVALVGIAIACVGYVGHATATTTSTMIAWLLTGLFGAMVMPSSNAMLSQRVPEDAQGELQGAIASIYSFSSVIGPPLMTQLFGRFSAMGSAAYFPGAAFIAGAVLTLASFVISAREFSTAEGANAAA